MEEHTGMNTSNAQGMSRRQFLAWAGAGTAAALAGGARAEGPPTDGRKPNIIIVLADDMGYADLGVHGCTDVPTPHIDSLARNGVRFTDAYVSCPVCSPMRAGLMTGRYQQRFGYWYNPGPVARASERFGLPLSETTLADALKEQGYVTGLVGKWHLGLKPELHPMARGFDEFFGFVHGSHSYVDANADKANRIRRGHEPVDEQEYLTDAFTREAVDFVKRHHKAPFFLYLSYNAVHTPLQAPPKYLDRFPGIEDLKRRRYAAMLSAMDDGVGAVLEALRAHAIENDTLVVFLSDNGGPPTANASRNAPLSGGKGGIQEGGIRVPVLMQWPRRLPKGEVYERPVISLDLFPTSVAAAGGKAGCDLDGVDLIPYVAGKKRGAPHKRLFWKRATSGVVRQGKWKLVAEEDGAKALYDLSEDLEEAHDLSGKRPRTVKALSKALAEWEAQLNPPLWERPVRAKRRGRTGGPRQRRPDTKTLSP